MKNTIEKLLIEKLHPVFLEIKDESSKHAGHNEAAKSGGTHFEVKIVSAEFDGKSRIQRHKMIYQILDLQLKTQVHALAIYAMTPEEVKKLQ